MIIDFSVSLLPLFVIAAGNFILSWIYYSPAVPWFRAWAKGVGMNPDSREMSDEAKKSMPYLMGGAVVASFLLSYGLQVLIHSLKVTDFLNGALAGVVVWFTFAVTNGLNSLFEGRKPVVIVINLGLYLITYAGFGGLVAVWK
jgi:hypothetical protein